MKPTFSQSKRGSRIFAISNNVIFKVYGWQKDAKREAPAVFLEFGIYPTAANLTMTPEEARELANVLLTIADDSEDESEATECQ